MFASATLRAPVDHLATTTPLLDAGALSAWQAAWDADEEATVFHHPLWAQISVPSGSAARARLVRADSGAVCAVKVDEAGVLRFLTDAHVTDLASPVGAVTDAEAIVEGFAEIEGWTRADLDGFAGDRWLEPMTLAAKARGWATEVARVETCPWIALPGSFDDYLASIDSKQRHEVRRKGRKLERELAPWTSRITDADTLEDDVDAFVHQHRLASGDKGGFMTAEHEALFRRAAAATLERGWLRLTWLETAGGDRLAAVWSYVLRGRWLVWNSSFDPAHRELSPGMVAMAEAIRLACEESCSVFDLLRGDEAYKYRLGAVDAPVFALKIERGQP